MAYVERNTFAPAVVKHIYTLGFLFATVHGSNANNPCTDASTPQLGSLRQRLVGYKLAQGEDAICDTYIDEGWYLLDGVVLASTNQRCGTLKNWYRNTNISLPDKLNVETDIELCRNGPGGDCDVRMHSSVIKCADDKYAFRLIPMAGCIEAYCLERISNGPMPTGQPPDITSIKPVINVAVNRVKDENELQFYCDFNPTANTKFHYKVSWTISQSSLSSHELHRSEPVRYLSQEDFRGKTMMTEKHLKAPTYFGLGVTIACSITASEELETPESNPVISEEKFCGIKALNSSNFVHISNDRGADIYFELTIPFGCEKGFENQNSLCYLDVTLFIPNSDTNCNIPDIVQRKGTRNSCGIRFHINDVGKPQKLHIQPKYPKLTANLNNPMTLILATSKYETHQLFSDYAVDTMQVTVSTEQNILNNKYCYAVCDPHMLTFDGLTYENQMAGIFDLYINTDYNQKVQIQTKPCNNNGQTPFCVCGVAVQAGSDVFALSTCLNTILDVRFVRCDDRILREKVEKVSETLYRVSLPSGTYVEIILGIMGHNMNVYVYPSVADFMKTSGLCGSFDGTTTNDRLNRPGFNDPDPNKSWMVNTVDDLFNEHVALRHWEDHYRFCTCNERSTSPTNIATCDVDIKKTCTAKPHFADRCVHSSHRKRRSKFGEYRPTDEGDFHKTVNVAFVSKYRGAINHRKERSLKTYTDETARSDCMQLLNTTAFQKCSSIQGLDFSSIINDCVLDAKITGTMDWTMSHLETIKSSCMQQIDIQKMPPKEDLDGMTITINGTSYSNISVDNASLSLSSVITQDMFEDIRMVSCLRECSGQGDCTNGSCICKKGHSGEDCSIDSTRPPEMKGIPDDGFCDLQERVCKKTSVFGNNLAFDNQVKCKIKPLEIHVTHEIVTKEDYRVIGVPQTYMEVSCQLAQRKKRSVDAEIDDIMARVYNISLSNNGVNFSEKDTLLVYDSACVNCNKTEDTFTCKKLTGFCVNDGKCHRIGYTIGCYVCAVLGNGSAEWQPGPGCTTTSYASKNNGTRNGLTSNTIGQGLTKSMTQNGLKGNTIGDGLTKSTTRDGLTSKTFGDGLTKSMTQDGLTARPITKSNGDRLMAHTIVYVLVVLLC
ncbi:von Willebrand factor D and EGF domain-containing protein-like [Dreissena polymorpha]|uniref:von Willebrand factor D and EGF domain-containing protein-like n=1 Tax=Dreissena polymorpha TaxID=45954 RepID=UPI002263B63F|nr:von Willebrand factor D and EGF domain-containing protein-like [Dreissena polymorpha]